MAENSKIEWTHHTFNPWIGCTKVSPACDHCYAEREQDHRFGRVTWGAGQPRSRTSAANWNLPLRWNREAGEKGIRYRVFCASLADVFDTEVPGEWQVDLLRLIRETPCLDWLLLTKRPEVARKLFTYSPVVWSNVWLGTTVENQAMADARIPTLLRTPKVAKRFLSMEPLLERVDLRAGLWPRAIDWVIVGGESGPSFRTMDPAWAADIKHQCEDAGVAFLMKQMSGTTKAALQDIPAELMLREYPQ